MTPKQTLLAHVLEHHRGISGARGMTLARLRKSHALWHFRYSTNHIHEGRNDGFGNRPRGWYTGEDVVVKKQGYLASRTASFVNMFQALEAEAKLDYDAIEAARKTLRAVIEAGVVSQGENVTMQQAAFTLGRILQGDAQ